MRSQSSHSWHRQMIMSSDWVMLEEEEVILQTFLVCFILIVPVSMQMFLTLSLSVKAPKLT